MKVSIDPQDNYMQVPTIEVNNGERENPMVVNKSSNLLALKYDTLLRRSDPFFPNNGPNV